MSISASLPAPLLNRERLLLHTVVLVALVLIAHNFCLSILPSVAVPLELETMRAVPGGRAYAADFDHSPGDSKLNPRSRVTLTEDGRPLPAKHRLPFLTNAEGSGAWSHAAGRIFFSATDNSDPRTNGRHYVAHSPVLYSRAVGYGAIVALLVASYGLRRGGASLPAPPPHPIAAPPAAPPRTPWLNYTFAGLVFLAGLYLATGTLAPYANTLMPHWDPTTGYLYNIDHPFHRAVFALVDGEPRESWEGSMLLRRVLYGVIAWPWMKSLGYETGGVLFNLAINLAGFAAGIAMVRRHVGERGAVLAAWLLALYPGAAYWVGQPYAYALIFPFGIAAFWLLLELPGARGIRFCLLSLALGVIHTSYDFHAYFLPATLLLLVWHRRPAAATVGVGLQILPLGIWLVVLQHVIRVPLENSNTTVYRQLLDSFFNPGALGDLLTRLAVLPETAADVFFGANFLFLPLLAVAACALDFSWSSFARSRAVPVLLLIGAALFAFCNLPPPHSGQWNLSGSWIARFYQPVFPALVLLLAWWWQDLASAAAGARRARLALVIVLSAGNALVCFGPAAGLRLPIAETAFYRFYDHTDAHWIYEQNLQDFGRRPLGFPRPHPKTPSSPQMR